MFKIFAKKENKKMYEVKVVEINTGIVETIITDSVGIEALAMNGYDIIEMYEA